MRAQELIHLHGLLFRIRRYLERKEDVSPDVFTRYDTNGVRPNHIHRGKSAHERAIALLLDGFANGLETYGPEQSPVF